MAPASVCPGHSWTPAYKAAPWSREACKEPRSPFFRADAATRRVTPVPSGSTCPPDSSAWGFLMGTMQWSWAQLLSPPLWSSSLETGPPPARSPLSSFRPGCPPPRPPRIASESWDDPLPRPPACSRCSVLTLQRQCKPSHMDVDSGQSPTCVFPGLVARLTWGEGRRHGSHSVHRTQQAHPGLQEHQGRTVRLDSGAGRGDPRSFVTSLISGHLSLAHDEGCKDALCRVPPAHCLHH
jgi:hypothetical protein